MSEAWRESLRVAYQSLVHNRLRTGLTILTIGVGAATVALLVSLASSALATVMTGVEAVGGRELVFVTQKSDPQAKWPLRPLLPQDAAALRERVQGIRHADYFMSIRGEPLLARGRKIDVDVAVGGAYPFFLLQEPLVGSLPREGDRARMMALSEPIARELFASPEAALGKTVILWNQKYTVIGVTREKPGYGFQMGGVAKSRAVFVSGAAAFEADGIEPHGFICVRDDGRRDHGDIMSEAASLLGYRHRGAIDFELFDMRAFLRSFEVVFLGIRLLVAAIACVSLVIAGAGIIHVMHASVRQRVSEIGIRRAVGACKRDIARQFLVESILLSAVGGLCGTMVGLGLAIALGFGVHRLSPAWVSNPSSMGAFGALVAAVVAGIVFGVAPSRRAASLDVVSCLRGSS